MALISNYIYGIIVFCLVITSGMIFLGSVSTNTSTEFKDFNKTFDKSQQLTESIMGLQDTVKQGETGSIIDYAEMFLKLAWNSLGSIFNLFGFMNEVWDGVSGWLGIPPVITAFITLFVIVLVVLILYAAFFHWWL